MNMTQRTFQVLYVPDGLVAECLDAIRVLSNPAEKHRAHITVRGPYRHVGSRVDPVSRVIESSLIQIHDAGNFFRDGQNTVYLRCCSSKLQEVWHKPDFGFNPHITLYNGSSRDFARRLWKIVSSRSYKIEFIAGPLLPLVSARRHQGGMALKADLDLKLLKDVAGLDIAGATIESLGDDERLMAVDKLCDYLSSLGSSYHMDSPFAPLLTTAVSIEQIQTGSWELSEVKELAKKNSATLGFLPDGAFDAYADRGWVLAAIANGNVVGYVVYRVANMTATLVHLCIDQQQRGHGVARRLFHSVVERTKDLKGILAHTRRDFPSHAMWPRLGFAALGEKPGRGLNGAVLTRWWYEHPHPTLFSASVSSVGAQSPIDVAIDLNIFYDLVTPSFREGAEESRSLRNDWLTDEIQLCVTGELFNEINRLARPQERQGQRSFAHEFKRVSGELDAFERAYALLSSIMGKAKTARQISDFRHLAHAAAANVGFFVTRDGNILKHQEDIERQTRVMPLSPTDLVIQMDQVRNAASYHPARFHGTPIHVAQVDRTQRKEIEEVFLNYALGERKPDFRRRLSSILPSRELVNTKVVLDDHEPVAFYCLDGSSPISLQVPFLRLRPGQLARTLARRLVNTTIEWSIEHNHVITTITDGWLDPLLEEALAEGGFIKSGAHWFKLNYSAIGDADIISAGLGVLTAKLESAGVALPQSQSPMIPTDLQMSPTQTALLERSLRPLKLINGTLDTIVIPVQPHWAQHLFDSSLAEQTLLGAQPELALNWENAYYRSPRSLGNTSTPFRVLWYVSQDPHYIGTGQVRAYSLASSVEVLPAEEAYNRYKRLGIYTYQQVLELSTRNPHHTVMVIRFCDIEVFKSPISRKHLSAILESSDNKKPSLMGPQRISESAFAEIYRQRQGLP